jgi:hypothetical protein
LRGRAAHGDCEIGAETDRRHSSRDSRRFTTARTARSAGHVPRVVRPAGEQVIALDPVGEFGKVGLRQQDAACLLHSRDARRVNIGNAPLEDRRAALGRHVRSVDRVFHREGDTVQRADFVTRQYRCLRRLCGFERTVRERDDRVDLWVHRRDAIEVRLHDLDRRDLLGADQFGQLGCVGKNDLFGHGCISHLLVSRQILPATW